MDALTFSVEIIKATAWPAALVVVALMIRKPVIELIPFLRRLKYKEMELEFSKELAQLKDEAAVNSPAIALPTELKMATPLRSRLLNIASISPSAAILEAWSELESASIAVASALWAQTPNDTFKNYPHLGEYLLQCKVINEKQLAIFTKLRELRNKAAHAIDLNLSEAETQTYIDLASSLIADIRGA